MDSADRIIPISYFLVALSDTVAVSRALFCLFYNVKCFLISDYGVVSAVTYMVNRSQFQVVCVSRETYFTTFFRKITKDSGHPKYTSSIHVHPTLNSIFLVSLGIIALQPLLAI